MPSWILDIEEVHAIEISLKNERGSERQIRIREIQSAASCRIVEAGRFRNRSHEFQTAGSLASIGQAGLQADARIGRWRRLALSAALRDHTGRKTCHE